jgi:hypothetical protein
MIKHPHATQLAGSLVSNLEGALDSAGRHRGKPVYSDTFQHWWDLVREARNVLATIIDSDTTAIRTLSKALEVELHARG